MPFDFTGKVIAISGAASGIGFATAQYLYSAGASLSLCDAREAALEAAAERLVNSPSPARDSELKIQSEDRSTLPTPSSTSQTSSIVFDDQRVLARTVDVSSSAQVDSWMELTHNKFGRLDGAANMAGVSSRAAGIHPITELSDEDWQFSIDINLTGVFYCMRAQLRLMERAKVEKGAIVNASSIYGIGGQQCFADYSASKHGVVGLTRSVAKEYGSKGIRVNCVAPGTINTPMVQSAMGELGEGLQRTLRYNQALGRMADPVEIAKVNAFLLSDDSSFVTGAVYVADGGQVC